MNEKIGDRPSRRSFCTHAMTLAFFSGAVGTLLEGCGSPTSPTTVSALPVMTAAHGSSGITLTIDANSPVANVGSAALLQSTTGTFLLAHTAQSSFVALSATCTHQTCTIDGFASQQFVCPCHGSSFDTSGRVTGGPAPAPLRQYSTQFANGVLTILA